MAGDIFKMGNEGAQQQQQSKKNDDLFTEFEMFRK